MRTLIVVAHPLPESFTHAAAARVKATLELRGATVDLIDLYADGFDPRLTAAERRAYFASPPNWPHETAAVADYAGRLRAAQKLVLIFPQWWFDAPAILKGFFDRVLAPGVAFDRRPGGAPIPRLTQLEALWVVSSTGAPWWIARLYMGDPVRRLIGRGVKPWVCPNAPFRMLTLHDMDHYTEAKGEAFLDRLERAFQRF
jgi:putative NADPH-quinone reductase